LPDARKANISIHGNQRLITISSPAKLGSAYNFMLSGLPSLTGVNLFG